ncbi:MAG: DegT/DnrJ/EryC1/StrS family aminotransferase [Proteobacteria bacterium]|nr:DegT/DnrJ/EryC1/StrS family aminotransferase [Pseudomonadota bacterium]
MAPRIPFPSDQDATGRTLGDEEIAAVAEALKSGTLTSTKGSFVKRLEAQFAESLGVRHAFACTSGTAAVHCALAALDPEPGDEVVTTSITDMGALTPILYQGAIPVFADVDPRTYNVTAESIEAVLSERTRAILVTHLFGNPCDMPAILQLARQRGIPVIEDCAQAYLARSEGRLVGSLGDVGCFSLQQGKHITSGEGGLVTTNDDDLARRIFLFINKAWGYGDAKPDHYFLALNYRMNEITGAVALAQLAKLEEVVRNRVRTAAALSERIADVPGVGLPQVSDACDHTFWKYCLHIDDALLAGGSPAFGAGLREYDVASAPRYIQKPAFQCEVFREQRTFGTSRYPFSLARPEAVDYAPERFPGTFEALRRILVLPWNEHYAEAHVDHLAQSIRETAARLAAGDE